MSHGGLLPDPPPGWSKVPLWTITRRVEQRGRADAERLSVYRDLGVIRTASRSDNFNKPGEDLDAYKFVEPGDLVLNKMKTWQGSLGVSEHAGIVSPAYFVCKIDPSVHPRYLHHLLRSHPYVAAYAALSKGIRPNQWDLPFDEFRKIDALLPPLDEQRRIADFLDAEMVRIKSLIELRQRQRVLLDERLAAFMTSTLGGLGEVSQHPQPTGLVWFPFIHPAWKLGPVHGYYEVQLGKMLNAERAAGPNPAPYLRNANVHWFETDLDDLAVMSFEPHERRRLRLQPGDLLVCEGGAGVAEAAIWDGQVQDCFYQKSLHRVRRRGSLPSEWLMYWLYIIKRLGYFEAQGNLATIPHLTGEQLSAMRLPIPAGGAAARVAQIRERVAHRRRVDQTLASSQVALAERQQTVITAAVTGQLDVTTSRGEA